MKKFVKVAYNFQILFNKHAYMKQAYASLQQLQGRRQNFADCGST